MRVSVVHPWDEVDRYWCANKVYRHPGGTHYLWPVWGVRVLVALMAVGLLLLSGCASSKCPPCLPETTHQDVNMPVGACQPAPDREPLVLPPYPEPPPENATEEQTEDWYAEMVSVVKIRFALLLGRIDLLERYLSEYDD